MKQKETKITDIYNSTKLMVTTVVIVSFLILPAISLFDYFRYNWKIK